MVISSPELITSGTPKGTVNSVKLVGIFSFKRYPFKHSTTTAGSSALSKVEYIPTACTMFLGTQILIPRSELIIIPIGDPLCHTPSNR